MSKQQPTTTEPICPTCGSARAIPIIYGLPTYEAFEKAQRGEFALGGCMMSEESPRWECTECHERFGHLFREASDR